MHTVKKTSSVSAWNRQLCTWLKLQLKCSKIVVIWQYVRYHPNCQYGKDKCCTFNVGNYLYFIYHLIHLHEKFCVIQATVRHGCAQKVLIQLRSPTAARAVFPTERLWGDFDVVTVTGQCGHNTLMFMEKLKDCFICFHWSSLKVHVHIMCNRNLQYINFSRNSWFWPN